MCIRDSLGCVCDTEIGYSLSQLNVLGNWQVYKTQYWGRHNANWWTGSLSTFGRVSFENYLIYTSISTCFD